MTTTVRPRSSFNPLVTIRVAVRALLRNKLRSVLTTLGIVIGVAAVIAMVAIGEGAKARVEKAFADMGTNMLMLLPGTSTSGGMRGGFGSMPTLTWDDLKAIRAELPSVRYAAPVATFNTPVLSDEQNWSTQVIGTTTDYFPVRNWTAAKGSLFADSDVEVGTKVVVIGLTVAQKLFDPGEDPTGRTVRIRNIPFVVIGVLASKGQSQMGQDWDDTVIMPVSTFTAKIRGGMNQLIPGIIMVGARTSDVTEKAEKEITELLRDRHHIQPGADDDFSVRNMTEMASAAQESTKTLTGLLMAIAAVSLLVGGIGIMNIMLVSVTERTREIGLRMAVGAKPRNILAQFLVESVTLSIAGGAIGVGLGILAAERLSAKMQWPLLIQPGVITLAVVFSAVVGIGFGLWPAMKASRLDPIDALRYE